MQDSVSIDRDKYIGGSDIPIIMSLSPYKSRYDLLLEKAGYKTDTFKGNKYTEYGNTMEAKIRDYINSYLDNKFVEGKHIREAQGDEVIGGWSLWTPAAVLRETCRHFSANLSR